MFPNLHAKNMKNLKFDDQGLIPAILQDDNTLKVLMMAWMNEEALRLTLSTSQAHFWSRSRQELWHKGATSGNIMHIQNIYYDCDGDALLLLVKPDGPACHTGKTSCFYQNFSKGVKDSI